MPVAFLIAGLLLQPAVEIAGDYIEGRSNHVYGCYCEWSGESVMGGNEAILAWRFRRGEHRGVPLAGVKAAAVLVGERTLSMGMSPRRSVLFIDGGAAAAQKEAVENFLRENYGLLLGTIGAVQTLPIEFESGPESARLGIGEFLNLSLRKARLPEDALQGARLWYDPFIPLAEVTLATTVNHKYRGTEFGRRWEQNELGTSGYFGRFRLQPK